MEADSDMKKEIVSFTSKMDHRTLDIWAADCAEHVLFFFEDEHPHDSRPRKAVEAGRAWIRGELSVNEARSAAFAAHAAARDAKEDEARAVARATGHAAATAHVAGHAVHAANYAAKANNNERAWQYQHLFELMDDLK
ncbi:putative immunity protein [Virgibacillus sp. L01]|uniref:putative immunity protein n=1 Tax=Virgibacillus sp. L01 TaxID=3457429 RepID=UPI003FD00AEC